MKGFIFLDSDAPLREFEGGVKKIVYTGASWCKDCRAVIGKVSETFAALQKRPDVQIYYVSLDETREIAASYAKEHGLEFSAVFQGRGNDGEDSTTAFFDVLSIPAFNMVDGDKKTVTGYQTLEQLVKALEQAGVVQK